MSHAFDLLKVLTPPLGDTPEEVRHWRWLMAGCLYALIVAFILHLAWVGGALKWAGIEGVASAEEVGDLSNEFKYDRQLRLESEIFNTRRRLCVAVGALRDAYAVELTKLISQWRELTDNNTGPEILDCTDLGGVGA